METVFQIVGISAIGTVALLFLVWIGSLVVGHYELRDKVAAQEKEIVRIDNLTFDHRWDLYTLKQKAGITDTKAPVTGYTPGGLPLYGTSWPYYGYGYSLYAGYAASILGQGHATAKKSRSKK